MNFEEIYFQNVKISFEMDLKIEMEITWGNPVL